VHLIVDVNCPPQVTEWVRSKTVIKMKRKKRNEEDGEEEEGERRRE
jgi:hypothetical protein